MTPFLACNYLAVMRALASVLSAILLSLVACTSGGAGPSKPGGAHDAADGATRQPDAATAADAATPAWGTACDPQPGNEDSGSHGVVDLIIRGSSFEELEGGVVRAATHSISDVARVYGTAEVEIIDGAFEIHFVRAFERGAYQPILLYSDTDGDDSCDPEIDHVWSYLTNAFNPVENDPYVWAFENEGEGPAQVPLENACAVLNGC